jgi:A/G-specific adenine glycosylase
MLQQTQVKTVIPYWERWMRKLPTVEGLANASADKIHKLWEGLGYYTRVRNMQKAAQQVIGQHDGKFPERFDDILNLPGIGRYTAGAICSIAFNQPMPILDGNVIRVLTRVFGVVTDPHEKHTNARLWQLATKLVEAAAARATPERAIVRRRLLPLLGERAGVRANDTAISQNSCSFLNQSLMELGALVCTPRSPNCPACPVQKLCVARKENLQDQLPNLGKRPTSTERRLVAYVVKRDGRFLARQRPAGVVNAHLWEFPNVEVGANDGRARHSARTVSHEGNGAQRTDAPYQFRTVGDKPLCTIKHSITRYRITLEAWQAKLARPSNNISGRWLTAAQLEKLAFTSAHKKILQYLDQDHESRFD